MGRPRKRQARAQKITADQVLTLLSGRDFHSFTDDKHRRKLGTNGSVICLNGSSFSVRPAGWWSLKGTPAMPERPHPYRRTAADKDEQIGFSAASEFEKIKQPGRRFTSEKLTTCNG